MSRYQAVTLSTHAHRRWRRFVSYQFAAGDTVAALVAHELGRACTCLPVAFVKHGDGFLSVAVLGFSSGGNLFVGADGRWLGRYVPAGYRSYPFSLALGGNGQEVLCVDEDSGLLSDATMSDDRKLAASQPLRFFDAHGQPDAAVKEVLSFLESVHSSRALTARACDALRDEGVLLPWHAVVPTADGQIELEGLYRVDELKLQALSADALHRLQRFGALSMAYCQLVSMQHLEVLGRLIRADRVKGGPARVE